METVTETKMPPPQTPPKVALATDDYGDAKERVALLIKSPALRIHEMLRGVGTRVRLKIERQ